MGWGETARGRRALLQLLLHVEKRGDFFDVKPAIVRLGPSDGNTFIEGFGRAGELAQAVVARSGGLAARFAQWAQAVWFACATFAREVRCARVYGYRVVSRRGR